MKRFLGALFLVINGLCLNQAHAGFEESEEFEQMHWFIRKDLEGYRTRIQNINKMEIKPEEKMAEILSMLLLDTLILKNKTLTEYLLNAGANPNAINEKDFDKNAPLHIVISFYDKKSSNKDMKIIKDLIVLLLKNKASLEQRNNDNYDPIDLASEKGIDEDFRKYMTEVTIPLFSFRLDPELYQERILKKLNEAIIPDKGYLEWGSEKCIIS